MAATGRPDAGGEVDRRAEVVLRLPHRTPPVWIVAAALTVLLGIFPVNSEIIFHRRDHLDQGKYLSNQPEYNVYSYSDALVSHQAVIKCENAKVRK